MTTIFNELPICEMNQWSLILFPPQFIVIYGNLEQRRKTFWEFSSHQLTKSKLQLIILKCVLKN